MQIGYEELYSTFHGSTALTHLILSGGDALCDIFPIVPVINLPALQFLHIGADQYQTSHDISGILMSISAPLLASLVLNYIYPGELNNFFGSHSVKFPSLRSLKIGFINDVRLLTADWANLSRAFPTVTRLSLFRNARNFLAFWKSVDDLAKRDAYPSWHSLQTFTLFEYVEAPISGMVSARVVSGCPPQTIRLSESTMIAVNGQLEWIRERVLVEQCKTPCCIMGQHTVANRWGRNRGVCL